MATGLMLKKLTLKNLLSFGPEGVELELGPLNVLIGPNASGKSNLIDAIRLLAACVDDVDTPIDESGGFNAWVHKAIPSWHSIELIAELEDAPTEDFDLLIQQLGREKVVHKLAVRQGFPYGSDVVGERIDGLRSDGSFEVLYDERESKIRISKALATEWISLQDLGLKPEGSILSYVLRSQADYDLKALATFYSEVSIYSEWNTSRGSSMRLPVQVGNTSNRLSPDGTNLALVLNKLDNVPGTSDRIAEELARFYPRAKAIKTQVNDYGQVEPYIQEDGLLTNVPFNRLSDGTLRWLCLLTVLLHPEPPSLICLEEPEVGLHPDMLRRLARLLVEASERTQLIVTTHSDLLISALSNHPEAIVVCEHLGGSTDFQRLNPDDLQEYISDYRLGEAWLKGEIGGTRY